MTDKAKIESEVKHIFSLTYGADEYPIDKDSVQGLIDHHLDTIDYEDPSTRKQYMSEMKWLRLWLRNA